MNDRAQGSGFREARVKAICCFALILIAFAGLRGAPAQAEDDFYKDALVQVIVGTSPGGGYDNAARLVTRHLGDHLPGKPKFIVLNKPGASGVTAANEFYSAMPRDGSVIAVFNSGMPYYQALGQMGIRFKAEEFSWLGCLSQAVIVVTTWHTSPIKTLDDAKQNETLMGALTRGGTMGGFPLLANATLGTKFKVITGYKGGSEVNLAMQRGEVDGRGGFTWTSLKSTNPDWVSQKMIVPLLQVGLHKDEDLPNVPLLIDLAQNEEQRQMFNFASASAATDRPFSAPPQLPPERLALLRQAFDTMVKSQAFIEDAAKIKMDLDPLPGAAVEKVVRDIVNTPPDIVEKVAVAMGDR